MKEKQSSPLEEKRAVDLAISDFDLKKELIEKFFFALVHEHSKCIRRS